VRRRSGLPTDIGVPASATKGDISNTHENIAPSVRGGGAFARICGHQGIAAVARAELAQGVRCHNPARLIPKLACDLALQIDSRKLRSSLRLPYPHVDVGECAGL